MFFKKSIFQLFFSGRYYDVHKEYEKNKHHKKYNNDDLHYIFAAKSIIDEKSFQFVKLLKKAKKNNEIKSIFKKQLYKEEKNIINGVLNQPKYINKSLLAAMIGLKFHKKFFVETGTYIGQSTYNIQNLFLKLYTCEASKDLYKAAKNLFLLTKSNNIKIYLSDSRSFLNSLNKTIANNSVFFLDAHYSTGITSKEYGTCPLIDELQIIINKTSNAVVVVDDIRTMNGKNGYPNLNEILNILPNSARVKIIYDQMIIYFDDILI
jgi:hypothetical protein